MREVLVVPEAKTLPDLLAEFKERKRHLAVVVDEFGSTAGVITVEDILAQLVGPIEDKSEGREPVALLGASLMELDASLNIRDLELDYQIILASRRRLRDARRICAGATATHSQTRRQLSIRWDGDTR